MKDTSGSIHVQDTASGRTEEIVTHRVLRLLPGKREVFEASWGGRNVITKVFFHPLKARLHYWRERRGLRRLAELQVKAPVLLLSGRTVDGRWAVVTEKIEEAVTALALWHRTRTLPEKLDLLRRIVVELARQHAKGVVQADLHMGNFMIRDETVYTLDVAQVKFRRRPLGRTASIKQLAGLLCYLSNDESARVSDVAAAYARGRQWPWGQQDDHELRRRFGATKRKGIKRLLRRCLRTTSRTFRLRRDRHVGVFARRFAEESLALQFGEAMEGLMHEGQILKDGNTCFVSRASWDGHDVVIKRYNHKGLWHSLRHTLKGSRARRNWVNANRLALLGIPTAAPLAYVDEWAGPLLWRSYFITEFVDARPLNHVLQDGAVDRREKEESVRQVLRLLDRLAKHHITHGDTKPSNILIAADGPVLTDLDGMTIHRWALPLKLRQRKDLRRLLEDQAMQGQCGSSERR